MRGCSLAGASPLLIESNMKPTKPKLKLLPGQYLGCDQDPSHPEEFAELLKQERSKRQPARARVQVKDLRSELTQRNDCYGWGIFILVFLGVSYVIGEDSNWRIGALVFILLMVIWELAYRLALKSD